MKSAFLLLGAQRSGTSVTSHMLSKFGIDFGNPNNFLQADHNPIFFELKWVNQFNDQVIQLLGHKYIDLFLPTEVDYENAKVLEVEKELPALIQREWPDVLNIGIKDPRFSLTFPIWRRALSAEGYSLKIIFVFRHPGDVLRSNQKLFYNWPGWDEQRHLHFWLRLNLAAIYFTRDYPVFFVNYDDMMKQPSKVARELAMFFNLDTKHVPLAAAVVDQSYQHYRQSEPTGDSRIDHYYHLLLSHRLSAKDYLSYREAAFAT